MAIWTCKYCGNITKQNYIKQCPRCGNKSLTVEGYVFDMDKPKPEKRSKNADTQEN